MNCYALNRFIEACLYFYFLKPEVGLSDRGSDFHFTTKSTFLFSVEKGFKGEVNEYENEAHCAAEDSQDLGQGVSVAGAVIVKRGWPRLRKKWLQVRGQSSTSI